ncbi:AidA/PixA family protein [Chromobacterium sp. CV08]|uniref:AidA/PixA family protein n=1 Tax=Chromobacterium sp. CV08 TaxID=3133274 RepID=UPI003DA83113
MLNIANVNIMVDCESILANPITTGTIQQPAKASPENVSIIADPKLIALPQGQGSSSLLLQFPVGSTICWRGLSLSNNADHTVMLYDIAKDSGSVIIDAPTPMLSFVPEPVPYEDPASDDVDPLHFTVQQLPDFYYECRLINTGRATYKFSFYITEEEQDNVTVLGYFYWTGTLTKQGA